MTEHPHRKGLEAATPITAEEIVARGGKRVVAFQLEPPKEKSAAARQARHRKGKEELGLKQLNVLAKDDANVRARLREIGPRTLQPGFERALESLHARGDDDQFLSLVVALEELELSAAVRRFAAATSEERKRALESLGAKGASPVAVVRRACEARLLRRAGQLADEEVEALAFAASPTDKRLRDLAVAAREKPEIARDVFAFARLEPARRRQLLTVDEETLSLAGEIGACPELAEIVRAIAKDRKLAKRILGGLPGRASGKAVGTKAPSRVPAPRPGWLSWLRTLFAGKGASEGGNR